MSSPGLTKQLAGHAERTIFLPPRSCFTNMVGALCLKFYCLGFSHFQYSFTELLTRRYLCKSEGLSSQKTVKVKIFLRRILRREETSKPGPNPSDFLLQVETGWYNTQGLCWVVPEQSSTKGS